MSKPVTEYEPTSKPTTDYSRERFFSGTETYSTAIIEYSDSNYSYIGGTLGWRIKTGYTAVTKNRTAYV